MLESSFVEDHPPQSSCDHPNHPSFSKAGSEEPSGQSSVQIDLEFSTSEDSGG